MISWTLNTWFYEHLAHDFMHTSVHYLMHTYDLMHISAVFNAHFNTLFLCTICIMWFNAQVVVWDFMHT